MKTKSFILLLCAVLYGLAVRGANIEFADANVKALCIQNWDTNGDGELSETEAAAVTDLGGVFQSNSSITSFNELKYFTGLTAIENSAFFYCTCLASIVIPNGVISIGKSAFSCCDNLTSIVIPNSVISIGERAFYGTPWYNNQQDGLVYAGFVAYKYKGDMPSGTTFVLKEGTKGIAETAFYDFRGLTSIKIPNSVISIGSEAFKNCTSLTSIVIPNSVTNIGTSTFSGCSGLTSVVIPNSVTNIGEYAFSGCRSLTSIEIPNSVTTIGNSAFAYCSGLTSFEIPNSVTSIGNSAFAYCSGLISIEIPNSVTSIGNSAFAYCSGLISIEIPNSVTSIGLQAFQVCRGLTSIIIPNSITTINSHTFSNCSGLTSIEIPNSVTSIGRGAFSGCSGLTSIVIPNSVTSIGHNAFYECKALSYLMIPNSITSILYGTFYNCSGLDAVISESEQPATLESSVFFGCKNATLYVPYGCSGAYSSWAAYFKNVKEMPATRPNTPIDSDSPAIKFADGNVKALCVVNWDTDHDWELSEAEAAAVTDLGDVFSNNSSITSFNELQYFTGLTKIGDYAFFNCWYLSSIEIPNSVTSISNSAFQVCISLTSIEIPNSVTNIGNSAFSGCSLTSIEIPSGVTNIGTSVFSLCGSLRTIQVAAENTVYDSRNNCNAIIETNSNTLISGCTNTIIPNSVTSIGSSSFYGCFGLTSIVIPNSVTTIGGSAFGRCGGLTSIVISNSVTSIGNSAFVSCSKLTSLEIPSGVTNIERNTFEGCCSLTSLVIPNSVTSIGGSAFSGCSSLTSIEIPSGVTTIGNSVFKDCSSLASMKIPSGVTSIGNSAFEGCSSLVSIEIPSSLTAISERIFYGCSSLSSTHIPSSVTTIGQSAFYGCKSLTSITIPSSVTTISQNPFRNCNQLISIKVDADNPVYDSRNNCNGIIETASNKLISGFQNTTIPLGITTISSFAYNGNSNLTSIVIPSSVSNIERYAFYGCNNLTSVTVLNKKPVSIISNLTFSNSKNATLYVPFGSKAAYEAANYWKEFKEIIEIDTRKVLDENGITIPVVEDIVDVRVLRTINANQWSTICLPFGMNENQVKEAFGDDVELGEFTGSMSTTDGGGRVTNISVNFCKAEHIEANCPYIIKVSQPVAEFTLENVDLIPAEEPAVTVNGDKFIGVYATNTTLDSGVLFLHDNQFWYSTGLTKMKAFRAYFKFQDVLTDVENASSRIALNFNDETTGIGDASRLKQKGESRKQMFDLQGRRVENAQRGLYIVNGKKVLVK